MSSKLKTLVQDFSEKNLKSFLRSKIPSFSYNEEGLDYIFSDNLYKKYEFVKKFGEAKIGDDDLIVIVSETTEPLTERSGKKNQYEIAKKILKQEVNDAALFVFYDESGNFRFSYVKAIFLGTKKEFTEYKRYTYYVSKSQSNKTFVQQIGGCSFASLDEILKAFSVEPLNKQFYQEINKAFYSLIGGTIVSGKNKQTLNAVLQLPNTNDKIIIKEFAVRLIGRTIFCWFLKNKKSENDVPLVPEDWLSSEAVTKNYYHNILEKLFFLSLNKKIEDREKFSLPQGHKTIPFLNGGLFEPHHQDFFVNNNANYDLKIPDEWFKSLFQVLEQFNFTIDENSSSDAEVSIDPEMLGTIFENLLAEIDPDTEKSARKSTGSFYTPREIVDYMVEQSLVQYLKTKTEITNEDQLLYLFKEAELKGKDKPFDDKTTDAILKALSTVTILDPACGSGAFPMGAVQKIVLALKNLDPEGKKWTELQLEKHHGNSDIHKKLKEKFSTATSDYARKLGVIQNSIYGVDIQSVATDISKLRSFLSLVIDENIDDTTENRGIEPLPNLEFKFVTANTLIALPEKGGQKEMFMNYEAIEQLKTLRNEYFQSSGKRKEQIKQQFINLQQKTFTSEHNLFADQDSREYKILSWKPFGNSSSAWFDPEWMFGVEKFDIVMGNPPYGFRTVLNKKEKQFFRQEKSIVFSSGDSAELFSKICFDRLVKENAILSFIIPKKSLYGDAWEDMRTTYWHSNQLCFIMDTGKSFANVLLEASVFCLKKTESDNKIKLSFYDKEKEITDLGYFHKADIYTKVNTVQIYKTQFPKSLLQKIETKSFKSSVIQGDLGLAIGTDFFSDNEEEYKLLKGIDIQRYKVRSHRYLKNKDKLNWEKAKRFLRPKVLTQVIVSHIENPYSHLKITACYDSEGILITNTLMSFKIIDKSITEYLLLGFLNSKINSWYAFNFIYSRAIRTIHFYNFYIQQIPLPNLNEHFRNKIEELVSIMLEENQDLEDEINIVFYKGYELTFQEIKIIDPEFELTKEEYENYKIED